MIETKARQAVTKQELTNRTSKELHVKDPKDRDAQVKDTKTKSDKEPAAGYVHNFGKLFELSSKKLISQLFMVKKLINIYVSLWKQSGYCSLLTF